jgi:hypothetical protein
MTIGNQKNHLVNHFVYRLVWQSVWDITTELINQNVYDYVNESTHTKPIIKYENR